MLSFTESLRLYGNTLYKNQLVGQLGHFMSKELGIIDTLSPHTNVTDDDDYGTGRDACSKWCERIRGRMSKTIRKYPVNKQYIICISSKTSFRQCNQCHNEVCIDCYSSLEPTVCPFCRCDMNWRLKLIQPLIL